MLDSLLISNWVTNILTEIALFFDSIVYNLARLILTSFYELVEFSSSFNPNSDILGFVIKRLMVLAAIYALFRVVILLINYLIEPSKFADGKTGIGFLKNTLIAIILLISSGFIFEQLMIFQRYVLVGNESNPPLIPTIIYGRDEVESNYTDHETQSRRIVNRIYTLFFRPIDECKLYDPNQFHASLGNDWCTAYNEVVSGQKDVDRLQNFAGYFYYTPFIPFFVGLVLVYYFFSFTFELARRMFRLIVLQVIFPIPVIMSIDPTNGSKRISAFFTEYFRIYGQVFMRVATIEFGFVLLALVLQNIL